MVERMKTARWHERWLTACSVALGRIWLATWRIHVLDLERYHACKAYHGAVIFVAWHAQMVTLIRHARWYRSAVLVSPSRDGELAARTAERLGVATVRGDSQHHPARALLAIAHRLRQGQDVAIFADGPLGPARQVKPGVVALAQLTGCVLLPVGAAAKWKIVFGSWDRFILPLPFSRIVIAVGEPLTMTASAEWECVAAELAARIDAETARAEGYC